MPLIILHDTRLTGEVEAGLGQVVKVDARTTLAQAFNSVKAAARSSDAELVIACHGYTTHTYNNSSNAEARGGFGLQLCQEDLRVGNVQEARVLSGHFQKVWIMACAIAGAQAHSSRPFCREFAGYVNAPVIAADRNQIYYPGHYDNGAGRSHMALRFGRWEGTVYQFEPDGTFAPIENPGCPLP